MVWIVWIACSLTEAAPPPGGPERRAAMQEHRVEAIAARDAAVRGDLEGIRAAAAKLEARLPLPGLPATLDERQAALKAAAHDAVTATTITDASVAVGRIAEACGACHAAAKAEPPIPSPAAPSANDGIEGEMSRHRAAADLLWLGLVRPDDQAIRDAATLLKGGHLVPAGADVDPAIGKAEADLDRRVHDLVDAMAAGRATRGIDYGSLLATCAVCHLVTGGGPLPRVPSPLHEAAPR